jgi:hypothetical protein
MPAGWCEILEFRTTANSSGAVFGADGTAVLRDSRGNHPDVH